MNNLESFYAMFYLLSPMYFKNTNQDGVVNLLSGMDFDSGFFEKGLPVDQAYLEDWNTLLRHKAFNRHLPEEKFLDMVLSFIEFYQENFELGLDLIIHEVKHLSLKDVEVQQSIEKGRNFYRSLLY